MFYNQERSIGILVAASSGSDIVKVGKAVEAKLAELKDNRLPAGVDCHKIFYQRACGGFAGNVRHQPDRIRRHRRVYPDAGDGVQEWPDYRHQFGGDCFRIISFPAIRRGNDAACLSGGFRAGDGDAGRQCYCDYRRHIGGLESRER